MRTIVASTILFLKERKMCTKIDGTANQGTACSCTLVGGQHTATPCRCVKVGTITPAVSKLCGAPPPVHVGIDDGDELASLAGAQS